jgi:hypothetical protein
VVSMRRTNCMLDDNTKLRCRIPLSYEKRLTGKHEHCEACAKRSQPLKL